MSRLNTVNNKIFTNLGRIELTKLPKLTHIIQKPNVTFSILADIIYADSTFSKYLIILNGLDANLSVGSSIQYVEKDFLNNLKL